MTLTNDQLEERVVVIENKLNEIQGAVNNSATKRQLKSLSVIQQQPVETDVSARLTAIETKLNEMQTALNKTPTKAQLNSLSVIKQDEINELKQRVTDLESQVAALQSTH
jgi:hypothetical protein